MLREMNCDGLIGPTHNYAGLAFGNVASTTNVKAQSSPKNAALQGLDKMVLLMELGVPQGILPPHPRPYLPFARAMGFTGSDQHIITTIANKHPEWLPIIYSASSMWVANAAMVTPCTDTRDGNCHITPANLIVNPHRSIESAFTAHLFQHIFAKDAGFAVHSPLPDSLALADEGAANHTRFWHPDVAEALHFFVYGRSMKRPQAPKKFPARQTEEACEAIVRRHHIQTPVVIAQQNPNAIDQGIFHNDVISVGNKNVLLCHEEAYVDQAAVYAQLQKHFSNQLIIIEIKTAELSILDAVSSYLFNSQLVDLPDGHMALIAPTESRDNASAFACINRILSEDNPIHHVHYVNCRESMKNGGGPACLRLRMPLIEHELKFLSDSVRLNSERVQALKFWINRHYRDTLNADDLRDPQLLIESFTALDELTKVLNLGNIYPFQVF
jgi:succinylarginine dihydrolase